jgi:hypothetical protein
VFEASGELEVERGEHLSDECLLAWLGASLAGMGMSGCTTARSRVMVRGNPIGSFPKWLAPLLDRGEVELIREDAVRLRYRFSILSLLLPGPVAGFLGGVLVMLLMGFSGWPAPLLGLVVGLVGSRAWTRTIHVVIGKQMAFLAASVVYAEGA